jgi:hypothetical protein
MATLYKYQVITNRRNSKLKNNDIPVSELTATMNKHQVIANGSNSELNKNDNPVSDSLSSIIQDGSKLGYFNAIVLNQAYIIGANRNYVLNIISAVIIALVLGGIFFHTILRLKK